ncbi:MAG: hypothetical protein H6977_07715 [Gammaproteobacteria bacterium]|nr:hypothetical protein [Gammaproteobacteria bacterium]MCP5199883.1 hypothetical protein [Gammaproteobacteria bacterium]
MTTTLLDPTGELDPVQRQPLAKPARLDGLTVGLLDISKARGDVFLDRLHELLGDRGVTVKRYKKPTFTRPAPLELVQKMAGEVDVVVEGLAD